MYQNHTIFNKLMLFDKWTSPPLTFERVYLWLYGFMVSIFTFNEFVIEILYANSEDPD